MHRVLLACALVLAAGPASAQTRWTIVRSATLTVVGDQSPRTLRRVAEEIEQFREVVGQLIGTARPPSLPTIVYVFGTSRTMAAYSPPASQRARMAGFYLPDSDLQRLVLALDQPGDSPVAFHEYMHLLLDNAIRGLPAWLSEGLAEYFSSYRLMVGGRVAEAGGTRPVYQELLRDGYLPIADLLTQRASGPTGENERLSSFYAHAWALTHYILNEVPSGGGAINSYVARVRSGRPPAEAFRDAFRSTPTDFDARLRQYIRRDIFPTRRFPLPEPVDVSIAGVANELTAAETDAWLGDLLLAVRGYAAAAASIEAAAKSAPQSAVVQLALARLQFARNQNAEGLAALARAAAIAPDDFLIQLAYGGWLLRRGSFHPEGTAAADAIAREVLIRAAALNQQSAEPHARLATIYARSPATFEAARKELVRAIDLSPGRLEYSVRLADLYLRAGNLVPARALLTAVLATTSDLRLARAVSGRLARIAEALNATVTPDVQP